MMANLPSSVLDPKKAKGKEITVKYFIDFLDLKIKILSFSIL